MISTHNSLPTALAVSTFTALMLVASCADSRSAMRREQDEEQAQLAMRHAEEQRKIASEQGRLTEEQADEQMSLDEKQAREDYAAYQREQEAAAKRSEVSQEEQRKLASKAFEACEKLPVESLDVCPLEPKSVQNLTYIDEGVAVGLKPGTGDVSDIERHVECFKARMASRALQNMTTPSSMMAGSNCLVMFPNVDVKVVRSRGQVAVNLQTDDKDRVAMLRDRARATLIEPGAAPQPPNNLQPSTTPPPGTESSPR